MDKEVVKKKIDFYESYGDEIKMKLKDVWLKQEESILKMCGFIDTHRRSNGQRGVSLEEFYNTISPVYDEIMGSKGSNRKLNKETFRKFVNSEFPREGFYSNPNRIIIGSLIETQVGILLQNIDFKEMVLSPYKTDWITDEVIEDICKKIDRKTRHKVEGVKQIYRNQSVRM